ADPLRPDVLARGMHRHDPRRMDAGLPARLEELVLSYGEAALLELAVQEQTGTGPEPVDEPGAVEPDGLRLAGGGLDVRLQDREPPPPGRPHPGQDDLDLDGGLLPELQLGQSYGLRPVAVAVRQVPEQIAEARNPHLR